MSFNFEKYTGLLEKRLILLRALAQLYMDCRQDFVSMDIDRMYARISEQEELCRRIQALDPEIEVLQRSSAQPLRMDPCELPASPDGAAWADRLLRVMRELGTTQTEVGRLNQIHAAYLQRARKTIHVLMNSLGINALSYSRHGEFAAIAGHTSEKG